MGYCSSMEPTETSQSNIEEPNTAEEPDFLADVEAADPDSFNVCISCD
jgi:hypothetical protein